MSRTRSFDEAAALDAICDVFWRNGYDGASYADLMKASGLGKGSLYAAWGDKAALYRAALARYVEAELGALAGLLGDAATPAGARLRMLLDYPIDAVASRDDRRGCFLCNASIDRAPADPKVAEAVESAFAAAVASIDAVAQEAEGANRRGRGAHLFSVFLGLRVMARSGAPVALMREARDAGLAAGEAAAPGDTRPPSAEPMNRLMRLLKRRRDGA